MRVCVASGVVWANTPLGQAFSMGSRSEASTVLDLDPDAVASGQPETPITNTPTARTAAEPNTGEKTTPQDGEDPNECAVLFKKINMECQRIQEGIDGF